MAIEMKEGGLVFFASSEKEKKREKGKELSIILCGRNEGWAVSFFFVSSSEKGEDSVEGYYVVF